MKVADTLSYCSAKTPILVTEGIGKVLFDGDRNEMPEELEELDATRFEFLFRERKFWVSVIIPAQPGVNYADLSDSIQVVDAFGTIPFISKKEKTETNAEIKQSPAEVEENPYYENCGNCAFFNAKNYSCRVDRETKKDPTHKICWAFSKNPGIVDENDTKYQFEIVARRALLAPPLWMGGKKTEDIRCSDCAWYVKEKGRCWTDFKQECNAETGCSIGRKRSDYE